MGTVVNRRENSVVRNPALGRGEPWCIRGGGVVETTPLARARVAQPEGGIGPRADRGRIPRPAAPLPPAGVLLCPSAASVAPPSLPGPNKLRRATLFLRVESPQRPPPPANNLPAVKTFVERLSSYRLSRLTKTDGSGLGLSLNPRYPGRREELTSKEGFYFRGLRGLTISHANVPPQPRRPPPQKIPSLKPVCLASLFSLQVGISDGS